MMKIDPQTTENDARKVVERTFKGPLPCLLPEYLRARAVYHAVLVRKRKLNPDYADKLPAPRLVMP